MPVRAAPLLLLMLSACADTVNAPSLAHRAIEDRSDALVEPPAAPPRPADAALTTRIAALLDDARRGDTAFRAADAADSSTIAQARGATEGSETWIAAQIARSALEAARQKSSDALAALDTMLVAQAEAVARTPGLGGLAELQAAEDEARAIVARQDERLATLTP